MKRLVLIGVMAMAAACPAVAQSPPPGQAPGGPGDALFAAGKFAEAADAYRRTLAASPADAGANAGLAAVELYANDLGAARSNAQAALAADPQNPRAGRVLAEVDRRETDWAKRPSFRGSAAVVPFVFTDPLPAVKVQLNGLRTLTFLIDTGAPGIVLDAGLAREMALPVAAAGVGTFAGGSHASIGKTTLASVTIGDATAFDVSATVLPTRGALAIPGVTIDGIVGTGFLERFLATIDYPKARLVLRPRDPAASAAFLASAQSAGAAIVPFWLAGDHFVIAQARVNDAPPGLFLFDSGLAGGGLMPSPALVASAGLQLDTAHAGTGVAGGGAAVKAVPFVARTVAVGTAVVHDVPGLYTPDGSMFGIFPFTVDGAVSHDVLKHFAYTVDFDAMKLVLAPA
jgi:tetratricopeptide (TPR) repeat protein